MNIPLGISRRDLVNLLGQPDCVGGTSRKYKTPSIYKYGHIEFWFGPRAKDTLNGIWNEETETLLRGEL